MPQTFPSSRVLTSILTGLLIAQAAAGIAQTAAATSAKEVKVQQLFAVMHMDTTYAQITGQMMRQSEQAVSQVLPEQSMNAAQKQEYASYLARVQKLVTGTLSWGALEPGFVHIYADEFTDSELDDIIAFYRSPAGQALIAKQPQLAQAASGIVMQKVQQMAPQLRQMMQDEMKIMTEKTSAPPSDAKP